MAARYLADKSALARAHVPSVGERLEPLFLGGDIATCGIVDLEVLFSARTSRDYAAILADHRSLPHVDVGERGIERASKCRRLSLARDSTEVSRFPTC